jgi:hypothetical protein
MTDFVCFATDALLKSVESGRKPRKKTIKSTDILGIKVEPKFAGFTRQSWIDWWDETRMLTDPPRARCLFTPRQLECLVRESGLVDNLRESVEGILRLGLEGWCLGKKEEGGQFTGQGAWQLEFSWLLQSAQNMSKFLGGNYCKKMTRAELRKKEREASVWDKKADTGEEHRGFQSEESAEAYTESGCHPGEEREGYGMAESVEAKWDIEDAPF